MAIKYISKTKSNSWKVSVTKSGKAIKIMKTQKEAIAYAATINDTEVIMIKRESGWKTANSWDRELAEKAVALEAKNKAKGMSDAIAKDNAAKVAAGVTSSTNIKPKTKPKSKPASKTPNQIENSKNIEKTKKVEKACPVPISSTNKKNLSGIWGFILGLLIISVFVGGAFLLGYFI